MRSILEILREKGGQARAVDVWIAAGYVPARPKGQTAIAAGIRRFWLDTQPLIAADAICIEQNEAGDYIIKEKSL